MSNILDHVSSTPVLELDDWPRSATLKEWFVITRRIQDTITDMNLDPAAEAEVIEAFTGVWLLCSQSYPSLLETFSRSAWNSCYGVTR